MQAFKTMDYGAKTDRSRVEKQPFKQSDIVNIKCEPNAMYNTTQDFAKPDKAQQLVKILDKIMKVCSKYWKGKGKYENLPSTIESVYKKNKLLFNDLNFLCNKLGTNIQFQTIEQIGEMVTKLKSDNARMVRLIHI